MTIGVDFDHTICDTGNPRPGRKMGDPFPGAKERLEQLRKDGHYILIHSCNRPQVIKDWMGYFKIPYDSIWGASPADMGHKPACDIYLDDRAVRFESWDKLGPDPREWK